MPVPNANPEFRQHLSAEQAASVDQAITQGKPVNTQEMAVRNILQTYESPEIALQNLANGKALKEARIDELDKVKTAGTGFTVAEQEEYNQLARQFRGDEQLERALPKAFEQARIDRIIDYHQKPLEELEADVKALTLRYAEKENAAKAAKKTYGAGSPELSDAIAERNRAKSLLQEAEQPFNEKSKPAQEQSAQQATAQREQQRLQEEKRVKDQRVELEGMDVDLLGSEIDRLETEDQRLQQLLTDRQTAGAGEDELNEIRTSIARVQERSTEADRIYGNKLTKETESIDKDVALENEESLVNRATVPQLSAIIHEKTLRVNDMRDQLDDFRDQLDNPPAGQTPQQRREIQRQYREVIKRVQREESMLRLNQDALYKSDKEFRDLDPKGRAEELAKIAEGIDIDDYDRDDINAILLAGGNPSKEELAAWTKQTIVELTQHGRENLDMGQLNAILTVRPELCMAIAQGFKNSRAARELQRREMPNNWEKIWDFAARHPSWLMMLLAIVAGTAGAAAIAVGPGLGVAAGAAGVGGGAFGVSRRRNWG